MNVQSFKNHLKNQLIPFWNRMEDRENGGFYGYADEAGIPDKESAKGGILSSRILWFYSAAYNLLKEPELLEKADHAYRFLAEHFYDSRHQGMYWSVKADGTPLDMTKHTYNLGFAVYGLAEYYMASGYEEALRLAYRFYHTIEEKCRDGEGYFEAFSREFLPASNEKLSENGVMATRTMNTVLHLMEAYTQLYEADQSREVGDSIREILRIFKEKVYNPETKSCEVFFDKDYHSLIDLESFGHNIEASWLVNRACTVLGDQACYGEMRPVIDALAAGAFENGYDRETHAMYNECENGVIDAKKVWWGQAEAVTGFYNAYQMHPEQEMYKDLSGQIWKYIQDHVIDQKTGEWVENISPDNTIAPGQALVHEWKCPYHNGRMCIEMINRLQEGGEL